MGLHAMLSPKAARPTWKATCPREGLPCPAAMEDAPSHMWPPARWVPGSPTDPTPLASLRGSCPPGKRRKHGGHRTLVCCHMQARSPQGQGTKQGLSGQARGGHALSAGLPSLGGAVLPRGLQVWGSRPRFETSLNSQEACLLGKCKPSNSQVHYTSWCREPLNAGRCDGNTRVMPSYL